MCRASAHNRALKDFCASLHPSLQPLRCYPMLLAKIVASENSTTLVDSNIMKMFYGGNGSDTTTSLSSSSSSSTPLAFRNLDMVTLSQLVSAAAGVTSVLPTSTAAQLLQLVAANALSLRPMSQFPDYVQSMKRALVKSEYDAAVQELLAGMPRGESLHAAAPNLCTCAAAFLTLMMQRWTGALSTAFTATSAALSAAAFFLCNRKLTTIARRTLKRGAAAFAARALKSWPFGP